MKKWIVTATEDVQNDLDRFIGYLLEEKINVQAAKAVLDDYDQTIDKLSDIAGTLKTLDDPDLSDYRKIRLRKHDYYLLYRICGDEVIIDRMFHSLQDLDKALK